MKKLFVLLLLIFLTSPVFSAPGTIATYTINPEKNAFAHNNLGVNYMEEKAYYAAIQEFKLAISLNPKTQATSTYFNNLGRVYLEIGYPKLALDCFNNAITQYSLNFEFYENLVKCFKALNQIDTKINEYKKSEKPLDKILLGLLYEQSGNYKKAIITLDEFVYSEPDLIITPAVKYHIQEIVDIVNQL